MACSHRLPQNFLYGLKHFKRIPFCICNGTKTGPIDVFLKVSYIGQRGSHSIVVEQPVETQEIEIQAKINEITK